MHYYEEQKMRLTLFFLRQHLAQNGSSAASVSNSPTLCKPRQTEKRHVKADSGLSAPAAVRRRCSLAHQMNEAAQLRMGEGLSGVSPETLRPVHLLNHACCCATHS